MANHTDKNNPENKTFIVDITVNDEGFSYNFLAENALAEANSELDELETKIEETELSIKKLTPECDKLDYVLAASSGVLCGIMDIFLVGKPDESPLGNITDKWYAEKTKLFAKLCGWKADNDNSLSSALKFLEKRFNVPYDNTHPGPSARVVFDLYPKNHHFKSLAHNPSILGLFFSVLDQFTGTSHFVSDGMLIRLEQSGDSFELRGGNIPAKFFCAIANWFGHIMSDVSGSSESKGRGTGIPSPLWTWMNDVIAIKQVLGISPTEFEKKFNNMAEELFKQGYDARFQTAQAIPVLVNEITVRLIYSIRRMVKYFADNPSENRSFEDVWKACEPFSNVTVKRMLTVAHGTFCLVDIGDAVGEAFAKGGGYFNGVEFILRLNIPGLHRFGISIYGEVTRGHRKYVLEEEKYYLIRKKEIVDQYIETLKELSDIYNDRDLDAFDNGDGNKVTYRERMEETASLAQKRGVPKDRIMQTPDDVKKYFLGGSQNE